VEGFSASRAGGGHPATATYTAPAGRLRGLADDHRTADAAGASVAYLKPFLARWRACGSSVRALATRILLCTASRSGVDPQGGRNVSGRPSGRSSFAAVINSPQLLMPSARRARTYRRRNGICVTAALKVSEESAGNHISATSATPQEPGPFLRRCGSDRSRSISPAPICSARA